jgi:hypothetical protein
MHIELDGFAKPTIESAIPPCGSEHIYTNSHTLDLNGEPARVLISDRTQET